MRLRPALLAVVVLTAACGSSSAANSTSTATRSTATTAPRPACGPPNAKTLAHNGVARVYTVRESVYGCSRASGRSYRLGSVTTCIRSARAGPVALAGAVVAYGLETCGVDTGSAVVIVERLSTGRKLRSLPATTGQRAPESYQQVGSLVVRSDGAVAWIGTASSIVRHSRSIEVQRADRRGLAQLDSGLALAPRSLRLRGTILSWRHADLVRSASLL